MDLETIESVLNKNLGYDFRHSKSRIRDNVYVRWVFFQLAKDFTKHGLVKIGKFLNKNHATVIHGLNKFQEIQIYEPKIFEIYEKTKQELTPKTPLVVSGVNLLTYGIKTI